MVVVNEMFEMKLLWMFELMELFHSRLDLRLQYLNDYGGAVVCVADDDDEEEEKEDGENEDGDDDCDAVVVASYGTVRDYQLLAWNNQLGTL